MREIFEALKGEPAYFAWIVRLLAFHGLRSGEACQLRCDDVTVLHGVPVLRIHDLHGSVKNRAERARRSDPSRLHGDSASGPGISRRRKAAGCFLRCRLSGWAGADGFKIMEAASCGKP